MYKINKFFSITIILILIVLIGGIGYFLFTKYNPSDSIKQNIQNDIKIEKMTDEEASKFFKITEMVSNNLPSSIKFWTEAYCPGSETGYDYSIPDGYSVLTCDRTKQEKGTHGGCPTCIMSEIELINNTTLENDKDSKDANCEGTKYYFNRLSGGAIPLFLNNIKESNDIKIGLYYNTGVRFFNSRFMNVEQSPESGNENCNKSFLMLAKNYTIGSEYNIYSKQYSLFSQESSHSFGGSGLSIKNTENISAEYVGLKINNINLIKDLKIQFVIDARGGYMGEIAVKNKSIIDKIFGIETASACGPAQAVTKIGSADLILQKIENGIYWYKITKPINLKPSDNLCYSDGQSDHKCAACDECLAECSQQYTQEEQEYYNCQASCIYGPCIPWPKGSMMFNVYYSPNKISGPLQIQVANIIFKDNIDNTYYAPTHGDSVGEYYKAYLVDNHCFVNENQEIPADCY